MSSKNIDATTGKISTNMWKLAWPILIGNLIQVLYNFSDTYWVGRLEHSTESIAAVSVSFSIVFVLMSLAAGLSVATGTLSAQYFGAQRYDKVKDVAYTSLSVLVIFSAIVATIGLMFGRELLTLLQTPEDVMPFALDYFNIIITGSIFMFGFFLLSGLLRGIGDTKTPMIIAAVSALLNTVLDPFIMFGIGPFPELGIKGAAYATVFSRGIVSIYLLFNIFSGKLHFKLNLKDIKIDFSILKQLGKIGMPAAVTQVVVSLGGTMLMGRINTFGQIATAVQGLGQRLNSLIFMPSIGLSQAAATMVGQNLGADQKDRAMEAGKFAIKTVFLLLLSIGIVFFIFPKPFLDFFSDDPAVINLGKYYVRFLALSYSFLGIRIVINGVLQGAGAAMTTMVLSIISLWGLRIPIGYGLSYTSLGAKGIWLGISISFVLSAMIMIYWFKKGKWLDKAVTSKAKQKEAVAK